MIKHIERSDPDSCWNKAEDDEPLFILRAQDALAPIVVKYWAQIAQDAGAPREKIMSAWQLAQAMAEWPNRKLPD